MTLSLTIPGPPVGKQRARTFYDPRVHRVVSKTPRKTVTQESFIKAMFAHKYPGHVPLEGPLEMDLVIYFPILKSASKKRQADMAAGREYPTKKPDSKNILGLVEDALNGLAYVDDCQIVSHMIAKKYAKVPRFEVKVRPVGEEP